MVSQSIDRLGFICELAPALLRNITKDDFSRKISPEKWSKKEIIGHLIDSASNNHQRFVRAQYEQNTEIGYDQEKWNVCAHHQEMEGELIISFWESYNKYIYALLKRIPEESWGNLIKMGDNFYPLEFVIKDYVEHLEHHLKQIIEY